MINLLNIVICIKMNMNCGGFVKNFYVINVSLFNGVNFIGVGYGSKMLVGSLINSMVLLGVVMVVVVNLLVL